MTVYHQYLIAHLWESTLFGAACCILIFAFGRTSSFSRHFLAWASILKFLVPFSMVTSIMVAARNSLSGSNASDPVLTPYLGFVSETIKIDTWIEFSATGETTHTYLSWDYLIPAAWLVGIVVLSVFWIRHYRTISTSINQGCSEAGKEWQALAKRVWEKPLRSMPRILVCRNENLLAGVFGFHRPAVIIPTSFHSEFNADEREVFLRHEFQHLYKHDNSWLLVQKLIRNLFWIHPLVWWLDRQISAEREIMRDAEVIRKTENAKSYLNCLMKASNTDLPVSYATSVGLTGSPFARRIKAILKDRTSRLVECLSCIGSIAAVVALTVFLSTTLSISELRAGEEDRDDQLLAEDREAEVRELTERLNQQTSQLEEFARGLETKQKNGTAPSDREIERLKELRGAVEGATDLIAEKTNRIRRDRATYRNLKAEMRELQQALERDSATPEEREVILKRIDGVERMIREYDRFTVDTGEPKISESEKRVLKEVIRVLKTDDGREAALALILDAIDVDSSAAFEFTAANLLFELGNLEEAIVFYQATLNKNPEFWRAAKNLGIVQVQIEDFEAAKPNLLKALYLGAEDGILYGLLGLCYLKTDDPVSAEHYYALATKLAPETSDWKEGLAESQIMQSKQPGSDLFNDY